MPDLAESLPLPRRLALSYAPSAARRANLALMLLDQRLGAIIASGREAVMAQIKLAWWRERLAEEPSRWPEGEPLLALLRDFPGGAAELVPLVNGWEVLLAERLGSTEIADFATSRAAGWCALAKGWGASPPLAVARRWAMADLALHLPEGDEAAAVREAWEQLAERTGRLPRRLRPLAVLDALSSRAIRRGKGELLDGPGALITALRVGILGR